MTKLNGLHHPPDQIQRLERMSHEALVDEVLRLRNKVKRQKEQLHYMEKQPAAQEVARLQKELSKTAHLKESLNSLTAERGKWVKKLRKAGVKI